MFRQRALHHAVFLRYQLGTHSKHVRGRQSIPAAVVENVHFDLAQRSIASYSDYSAQLVITAAYISANSVAHG